MILLKNIAPLLTLCCFLGLAGLTVARWKPTQVNILFLVICILGMFINIDILLIFNISSPETALTISRIDHFFLVYLIPVYIHFFHSYLAVTGRKWIVRIAYAYAFALMWITPTSLYLASMVEHPFGFFGRAGVLYPFFAVGGMGSVVYIMVLLLARIRGETDRFRKKSLKYVFAGFSLMGLLNGLTNLTILGYPIYPLGNLSFIPLIVFAVGIFRHDLLDMGILIRKGLIYSILSALLTLTSAAFVISVERTLAGGESTRSILSFFLFFLLIAFVFGPLKRKTQEVVDGFFDKGKYDYQKTLKQVSRMIVSVLDFEEIGRQLTGTVVNAMRVETCSLFLTGAGGVTLNCSACARPLSVAEKSLRPEEGLRGLTAFFEKNGSSLIRRQISDRVQDAETEALVSEMEAIRGEIALPLISRERLNGFIVLGQKLSGETFAREDIDLLETLSSQTSLAVDNARVYRIIEEMNRDLEKKVEARTRDLREAVLEKERTQDQLIRSESLAALGQLVAGVAHELNNPLASAISLIQSTVEDLEAASGEQASPELLLDDLVFAGTELARAKGIVASLLDLSRQSQDYAEEVDFNAVIQDALRILYNQYKRRGLTVSENLDPGLPPIRGNFSSLGQVALNLIKNAIQAIGEESGAIHLATVSDREASQVVFTCADSGPGIPGAIRKDIFKPFFTTKPVGQGTGLGLYICHEIVARHSGTIALESKGEEPGAKFVVRLPSC
jgi:two-component system, NtrC family, sensor kinase